MGTDKAFGTRDECCLVFWHRKFSSNSLSGVCNFVNLNNKVQSARPGSASYEGAFTSSDLPALS